jgi:ATP-dependent exoDNAse (exonuclease V) beta subunit
MSETVPKSPPPDQSQRERALDPTRSILVQAPAGSGKTTLLTGRFLTLLAQVDDPGQVVAITFTNAATAEMRNRILDELRAEKPSALARRALDRSITRGWNLLDLPAQLRIYTIDAFCRELALQQPLLSGLGGGLDIADHPTDLYRRAARHTMEQIGGPDLALSAAVEALLLWRDNNWQELEDQLVEMLANRDRWMHDFLLNRKQDSEDPNPNLLRERLERPFANAVRASLTTLDHLLNQVPGAREEALELARFACAQSGNQLHLELAELAEFPCAPFHSGILEEAQLAHTCLAKLLLTGGSAFRKQVNVRHGFPADRKREKNKILDLIARLKAIPGLETALANVLELPAAHYTEDEWKIVRACFTLLRHAAAQLSVVFAEAASVDYIEVAQIAQRVLRAEDGLPTDAALVVADGIRHLLVDEFQDTSRRQHQLLAGLIAAWPEREGRTSFAVGDPMQSIYFFRDADAELFHRVRNLGLEIPNDDPLMFDFVPLSANFRTAPSLVNHVNEIFAKVFAATDGSEVTFSSAQPARGSMPGPGPRFRLHLRFVPKTAPDQSIDPDAYSEKENAPVEQINEIVALIQSQMGPMERARAAGQKYRIAVLARARKSLVPIAQALREASIPFSAIDLEKLQDRPEVRDALALAHAMLNPHDRVAWLGVLRAPWCGLALDDLHRLTSADDPDLLARPVPELLVERLHLLSDHGRLAALRVLDVLTSVPALRASPTGSPRTGLRPWGGETGSPRTCLRPWGVFPTASLGTVLEQAWLRLGGSDCVDPIARANVGLLWSCLDRLPAGEQDLLGPALDAALDKLTALPDPAANTDFGVQLMTIHRSKGLEFEVVIVPDLHAKTATGSRKMLTWLERGLLSPDDATRDNSAGITEFLIAPLQSKGADRGSAKAWVDRVYKDRESQEDRRILYVAATRAREQLHLFARPAFKVEKDDSLTLLDPPNSLLATAWPALQEEVRVRFDEWSPARKAVSKTTETEIASVAASANSGLLVMPSRPRPTLLRRLPPNYQLGAPPFPPHLAERVEHRESQISNSSSPEGATRLYARHQGDLLSRVLGIAVHALLEEAARLRTANDWVVSRTQLQRIEPRIAAQVRLSGIDPTQAAAIAAQALQLALSASQDPIAQWILSPHADAVSEVRWTGVIEGALTTVRVDRVFRAGPDPGSEGKQAWWIVDYKTAHSGAPGQNPSAALPEFRKLFAPQLEAYAIMLRNLHGADAVLRAGLYYPRILLLDWWEL